MVRLHLLLPHSSIMNDPVNIYISLEAKNEKKKEENNVYLTIYTYNISKVILENLKKSF